MEKSCDINKDDFNIDSLNKEADLINEIKYPLTFIKSKCKNSEYKSISNKSFTGIDFFKTFPKLCLFIDNYEEILSKCLQSINLEEIQKLNSSFFYNTIESYIEKINIEIDLSLCSKDWSQLFQKFNGVTVYHTILVLALASKEILNLSIYDKNVLMWSILLHDISKHIPTEKELTKECLYLNNKISDKIHPFKSGALSLKILYDLKAIENNDENASMVNDIIELLRNSIEYRKSKNKIKWVHSHEALKDLEILIKGLKINSVKSKKDFSLYKHYQITSNVDWVIDIFLLVTFHQSLKNCESHMNDPLLTEEEVAVFFNAELLELMKVLMINDSLSRSRFLIDNSENEISKNMNNYINYIK